MRYERNKRNRLPRGTIGAAVLAFLLIVVLGCNSHTGSTSSTDQSDGSQGATSTGESISRDEAIDDHWDEVKEDLSGTEAVDACSSESGSCYTLNADIDDGEITEIHFTNGGSLRFSAEIESDGNASDSDENGNSWDFTFDMNSLILDDAVDKWAKANGYEIQQRLSESAAAGPSCPEADRCAG